METTIARNYVTIEDEMRRSYLDYAMSVIVGRALPDVRDGLKPVHRRALWSMHELGNTHNKPYKKSARVVGDALGKYHPHGDSAVYDTIVRMAQDFSLRYPLVDGQGNFGCFTGDTKIKLLDGTEKTFAELAQLPPDEIFYVYSVNSEGRIVVGEGRHARITRQQAELVELTLDSGAIIRCTPDHRFLLRNGNYKQAHDLTREDSLVGADLCVSPLVGADLCVSPIVQHAAVGQIHHTGLTRRSAPTYRRLAERADVYDITVDVHHNFLLASGVFVHNSIDGDNPAAQRYTEVRMARITNELLADIEKETVNFQPNYDESLSEPSVLPVRFPQLLVNGSEGIAVGMATKIPPHNLTEILNATIELVKNPMASLADLMKFVSGPDFPTGGFIYGRNEIRKAYTEGRGILQLRARAGIDRIEHGNSMRDAIVVTEIPYQVNKARLLERIGELVNEKRIDGIHDLRDESDRDGMRIVIELKRDAMPQVVLNNLYKMTPMQTSFGIISLAIVNGQPRILNLRQILEAFIDFRREVVRRRTQYELKRAQARAHILEGLTKAIDAVDYIVSLIRNAPSVDTARQWLMSNKLSMMSEVKQWRGITGERKPAEFVAGLQDTVRRLQFSEPQAQAILDLQLRRLAALERQKIIDELEALLKVIGELEAILHNDQLLRNVIVKELEAVRKDYGDARRTEIVDESAEMRIEDLIADEDVSITITNSGYIKRTPITAYRKQARGGKGKRGAQAKGTDFVEHLFIASTHAHLMVFTDDGQVYKLKVHELPDAAAASRGKALVNLINIPSTRKLARVMPVREFSEGVYVVMVTRQGVIKKTALSEFQNIRANGINAINVDDGDELLDVVLTDGTKQIFIATHEGIAVRFEESELRALGRATRGVRGADLREGDFVVSVCAISPEGNERMLSISEQGYGKQTKASDYRLTRRGGKGVINMRTNEKTGNVVAVFPVDDDSEIMIISQQGKLIRLEAAKIRETGRSASGVRLIRTDDGDIVTSASLLDIAAAEE